MKPENQKQQLTLTLIAVAVVVVFVLFGYASISDNSRISFNKERKGNESSSVPKNSVLAVAHHYSGGLHTYVGSIDTPTPCHKVSSRIFSQKTTPEIIELSFKTTDSGEVCAQVITSQEFMVSFSASSDAQVSARLNDKPISLLVTEVSSFDSLRSFKP